MNERHEALVMSEGGVFKVIDPSPNEMVWLMFDVEVAVAWKLQSSRLINDVILECI